MLKISQRAAHGAFRKQCHILKGLLECPNFVSRNPSNIVRRGYAAYAPRAHKELALNLRYAISGMERTLESVENYVDIDKVSQDIQQMQTVLEDPQLWITNPTGAVKVQLQLADIQHRLSTRSRLRTSFNRLKELSGLAEKANDSDLQSAVLLDIQGLLHGAEEYLVSLWLSDPLDQNSAYIHIRASSGDPDACDWASMVARMYTKWAHSRNYAVKKVEVSPGDVAGIRATTLLVEGRYAYGYTQYESGMHCLVRETPSDNAGTRQTFSTNVRVFPCIDDDGPSSAVDLKLADLKISTVRSHRTESAVRVVHIPTGITVSCQQEHSQCQNRTAALSLLRAKLYGMEIQNKAQSAADAHHALPAESWDAPIRSYTLQPEQVVKDVRTGYEVASTAVQDVLDGDLRGFMEASLRKFREA